MKEESIKSGDIGLEKESKRSRKVIKKSLVVDKKEYYENKFGENVDITTAWRTANEIMGNNKNLAPTVIKHMVNLRLLPTLRRWQKCSTHSLLRK